MRHRVNLKSTRIKKISKSEFLSHIVDSAIEKSYLLNELQLVRQSNFLVNHFMTKFQSFSRIRSSRKHCLYTSRARAVIQLTRSSRHVFKSMSLNGLLYGVMRASW